MQFTILALAATANAFPFVLDRVVKERDLPTSNTCTTSKLCNTKVDITDAEAHIPATPNAFTEASAARDNCGSIGVCSTFNAADQYVSTSGAYAYASPGAYQIRGPCPGLNAAANHGYLPRSGVATIAQTITGLGDAYNMAADLAGFLAAYAIVFNGDIASGEWSIGGPLPATIAGGILDDGQGISWSHNNYEGDTSIGRCDAYTNDGDAHSLSITRFNYAFETGMADDSYTLDKFSRDFAKNTHRSIQQNAYYYAPLFSTTLVSPAAYNFVINFMSNHSDASPAGYLNGAIFKEFFAVSGEYPNFVWNKGQERIPENWYRRPTENQYSVASVFGDLGSEFLAYPDTFRFGGNVAGTNTYLGIDIANFTNGVYTAGDLFEGDNFGCFFYQTIQQLIPEQLGGLVEDTAAALDSILKYAPYLSSLDCKQLGKYDASVFTQYTGNDYHPSAPGGAPYNC